MGAGLARRLVGWLAFLAVTFVALPGWSDQLQDVKGRGRLIWGGDAEGGAPYVFPREDDPGQVTGFEVELAAALAKHLGVEAEFAQGNWDKMPDLLRTQKIDVILNGYEWTAARAEVMDPTVPYYVYGLQLLARSDDQSITSWDDLKKPVDGRKRVIGVLTGSASDAYVTSRLGDAVDIARYDGGTDAMRETETGKLDANVQDTPIASFYASRFPKLRAVGEPVSEGYYVLYARKGEEALVRRLNEALVQMIVRGDLERIYKKYGIWDARQEKLRPVIEASRFFGMARAVDSKPAVIDAAHPADAAIKISARPHGLQVVRDYAGIMLQSAGMTIVLAVISFPLAIALGVAIAVGRVYGGKWIRVPLTGYVEFLRGTPLMLQLYFIFFFLPELGIRIPAFTTAILGLAVNYSAYEAEVYRAGLQAIPPGQMEAALSLGMTRAMAVRRIIVPQAGRLVIPPVVNDFIALFKDTSVCSVVTIVELTKRYSVLSMSTQATVELMMMTAVLYLLMSYPMSLLARHLENRLGLSPQP